MHSLADNFTNLTFLKTVKELFVINDYFHNP